MSLKIYVSAPWIHKDLARRTSEKLITAGYRITHKWWDVEGVAEGSGRNQILQRQGLKDYFGVVNADLTFLINSAKSEGKAVEQGIALAEEQPIIAVGTLGEFSKNVFHYLPNYFWFDTVEEAIKEVENVWTKWNATKKKS